VERDELGALFDPACGSASILCVAAQNLFDRRIVFSFLLTNEDIKREVPGDEL